MTAGSIIDCAGLVGFVYLDTASLKDRPHQARFFPDLFLFILILRYKQHQLRQVHEHRAHVCSDICQHCGAVADDVDAQPGPSLPVPVSAVTGFASGFSFR